MRFGCSARSNPNAGFITSSSGNDNATPNARSAVRREMGVCMRLFLLKTQ
jgi:hypothetical protein